MQDKQKNETPYKEIIQLFEYCQKIGVKATLKELFDGYKICFPSGHDFVQHRFSYYSIDGYVEPAIGCEDDYTAVTLENAKRLVKQHREKLNRRAPYGTE